MNLAFPNNIFKVLPLPCLLLSMDEKDFKIIDINDAYLKMCALDNVDLIGKAFLRYKEHKLKYAHHLGFL